MSNVAIPRGPRASAGHRNAPAALSAERILDNVSEKLYPRLALYEALAGYRKEPERRLQSGDKVCEARRNFLDSFANICDVKKGGGTVTAAALQRLQFGNLLWIAANEGIRNDIKVYAEKVLGMLREKTLQIPEHVQQIFQLIVEKCKLKIEYYNVEMQKYATRCRMQLREESLDDVVKSLRSTLKKLAEPSPKDALSTIVERCYNLRNVFVSQIRKRSKAKGDDFEKLAHYIGRVGSTRSSVRYLVDGMRDVEALRHISGIRPVEAPELRRVTIDSRFISPYEIVRAICQNSTPSNPIDINDALHAIVSYDMPLDGSIRQSLASRGTIATRVHAELQVADRFSRDRHSFVDDDKYIGCSKPACYFCHSWLSVHMHGYVLPATHHKIIPGCRGPDSGINESGAAFLKDMYSKMCRRLDQDILGFLLKSGGGTALPKHQYMSTEGSSRAPSQIMGNFFDS